MTKRNSSPENDQPSPSVALHPIGHECTIYPNGHISPQDATYTQPPQDVAFPKMNRILSFLTAKLPFTQITEANPYTPPAAGCTRRIIASERHVGSVNYYDYKKRKWNELTAGEQRNFVRKAKRLWLPV